MTPEAGKRAPFELLAFTAAPVAGALVVIELEGRFAVAPTQNGRFTRRPMLVVEPVDGRPRLELAPIRADLHDAYWRGAYAIPAEELTGARFSLGTRGTLLELPAPDTLDDTDRATALAREANSLRRALEAAEAESATARAEADATSAEFDAAVLAARDCALAESSERIASADQHATDAEARVQAVEQATAAAVSGTDVLRAELAEERERSRTTIAELESDLEAVRRRADALRNAAESDAQQRTRTIEAVASGPAPLPSSPRQTTHRGPGPWIAVAALILFAFVLLGVVAGFLA